MNSNREKIRSLTDEEKKLIGEVCCSCGSPDHLEYHHIVPLQFGGKDVISNMACVCYECHSRIHFGKTGAIDHAEITRQGLQRARERGSQIGQVKGAKLTTKKSVKAKEIILKRSKDFSGDLTDAEMMTLTGLSRNTFYKYKRELKEEA